MLRWWRCCRARKARELRGRAMSQPGAGISEPSGREAWRGDNPIRHRPRAVPLLGRTPRENEASERSASGGADHSRDQRAAALPQRDGQLPNRGGRRTSHAPAQEQPERRHCRRRTRRMLRGDERRHEQDWVWSASAGERGVQGAGNPGPGPPSVGLDEVGHQLPESQYEFDARRCRFEHAGQVGGVADGHQPSSRRGPRSGPSSRSLLAAGNCAHPGTPHDHRLVVRDVVVEVFDLELV